MKELLYISVTACFEISDAEMYGGPGSIGYTEIRLDGFGIEGIEQKIHESYAEKQAQNMADMMKVPREKVRMISKEEYDLCTKEPDYNHEEWSGEEL